MTTIDQLHARLDETPDDHLLRLVLADALQEAGGDFAELADGYRALGVNHLWPVMPPKLEPQFGRPGWAEQCYPLGTAFHANLPSDWIALIPKPADDHCEVAWRVFPSRRVAEDAAALAFSRLPARRRQEILAVEVTT